MDHRCRDDLSSSDMSFPSSGGCGHGYQGPGPTEHTQEATDLMMSSATRRSMRLLRFEAATKRSIAS